MVWGEKFLGVGSWGWRWVCGLEIEVGVRVRGLTPSEAELYIKVSGHHG